MCNVCGCGDSGQQGGEVHQHEHAEEEHEHVGPDGVRIRHVHGPSASRLLKVEEELLSHNNALATLNRARFAQRHLFVVNLMSSPGSGKTTLLVRTLGLLREVATAVIEGDQQTSLDADRIRATGAPAVQVNTGKGCHLDAKMVGRALDELAPPGGVLFIENVGNLVCPAGFDLGETKKVVVVSVTEGEDKPLKYPDMFAAADLVLVNKADLLPHLSFDVAALERNLKRVNPTARVLRLSATTGEGFEAWLGWLREGEAAAHHLSAQADAGAVRSSSIANPG
jgi:hydrogenase nickel incorporation protein HypB